ncbi:hypothetical protein FJTKL_11221 [Diaporthe vaccinii]|uniref:Uncharacterized protein n=1 Tax=Diaporthe vaccinii TaxID=105482 RepID=A0ABR4EHV5_9PEZI
MLSMRDRNHQSQIERSSRQSKTTDDPFSPIGKALWWPHIIIWVDCPHRMQHLPQIDRFSTGSITKKRFDLSPSFAIAHVIPFSYAAYIFQPSPIVNEIPQ